MILSQAIAEIWCQKDSQVFGDLGIKICANRSIIIYNKNVLQYWSLETVMLLGSLAARTASAGSFL